MDFTENSMILWFTVVSFFNAQCNKLFNTPVFGCIFFRRQILQVDFDTLYVVRLS